MTHKGIPGVAVGVRDSVPVDHSICPLCAAGIPLSDGTRRYIKQTADLNEAMAKLKLSLAMPPARMVGLGKPGRR